MLQFQNMPSVQVGYIFLARFYSKSSSFPSYFLPFFVLTSYYLLIIVAEFTVALDDTQ
jgi:hypothetical protein